ncbi:hypothetical protein F4779DRAFT_492554 [Xylariaceae sp. FL0662B]|nr:hypothetical protein F4779DRAFT_492554 [Xylariaceae sp. FL0662B]
MASIRSPSESRGRGGSGSQSKRLGGIMETSKQDFPPVLSRIARREAENSRLGPPLNAQSRTYQSRIPQNPSARKTSTHNSSSRPPLTHESQSWSIGSGPTRSTTNALTSASTVREQTSSLKQPQNVVRRKQSSISQERASPQNQSRSNSGRTSSSSSIPRLQTTLDPCGPYSDQKITSSPVEIRVAQKVELAQTPKEPARVYPELDRYRDIELPPSRDELSIDVPFKLATDNLPPPTPLFSGASSHSQLSTFSASPSTRFSDSPGPSPYSRDTTPTSMSSQSPGFVAPMRLPVTRARQPSPAETRPPVTRRRAGSIPNEGDGFGADPQGLAAVREALTSSSSNSTVRAEDKKEKKSRRGLSPTPPKPPPRKSSQKFKKEGSEGISPSKASQIPPVPQVGSLSPTKTMHTPRERTHQATSSQSRFAPPSRPSRDGTPDLYSQFGGPVPIIHSNLSSASLTGRRQSGQLAPSSLPKSTSSSVQDSIASKTPVGREPTPSPGPGTSASSQPGRTTRTPSPGVSAFKTRFPLFGRRTKAAVPEAPHVEKKEKLTRRGPAAGTGYEGYGRIGAVKRRSSNAANVSRTLPGPVSSAESLASTQSTDLFLLERMNPVIIAGGEVVENRNTSFELSRTESNQSIPSMHPEIHSRSNSGVSLSPKEETRQTLWPSPFPNASIQSRRPSDSSGSESVKTKPTIAFRRSVQRLESPNRGPLNLPKPIITRGMSSPSVGSIDTTTLTDDSLLDSRPELTREVPESKTAPKKLTKRARSPRKWNLFSRSQSQPNKAPKKQVEASVSAVAKPALSKPIAYYTMMDSSEQEDTEEQDVTDILREAEVFNVPHRSTDKRIQRPTVDEQTPEVSQERLVQPRKMGSRSTQIAASPRQTHTNPSSGQQQRNVKPASLEAATARPSRLPQVGRIPKVVNTRPEQTSPKSFSRPFNRISLQFPTPRLDHVDQESVAKGPSPSKGTSPEPAQVESADVGAYQSYSSETIPTNDLRLDLARPGDEFLTFPPPECIESSGSSNSESVNFSNHAIAPPKPMAPLGEDEIWDEYNDLLGEVPPSATSSRGYPFHLDIYDSGLGDKSGKPLMSPTINTQPVKDFRDSIETGKAATSSSHYSADMTARINAAFGFSSDPPGTQLPAPGYVSDSAPDNSNVQAPVTFQRGSGSSNRSAEESMSNNRSSSSSRTSDETPLSQVNLRVGSMTVSKWLSFGHVLFSPVREDLVNVVGSLQRHSILVIDGLGNDDWSFYAAETYPAATFYNLSPRAPLPKRLQATSSFPLSPPNHHQIQFTSYKDKFPFGPDSFTLVVFRFPSAAPESHYRNIISEARRVLKPGGYIELSILDVDLNNMGNRTRRAVRHLKERVSVQNSDFNLSSTSDIILRLLGKKGFIDIKSCRVGVPVASAITNASGKRGKKDERSLAEMMNDKTETGDENITKMVSKVGRWWYNRCYEVPMGMKTSIWKDRALLAECDEWGTSLKLMVCHARMPDAGGRLASI